MKASRKDKARSLKIMENLKEPTLLGKKMMFLPQTHHPMQMKRQIFV